MKYNSAQCFAKQLAGLCGSVFPVPDLYQILAVVWLCVSTFQIIFDMKQSGGLLSDGCIAWT